MKLVPTCAESKAESESPNGIEKPFEIHWELKLLLSFNGGKKAGELVGGERKERGLPTDVATLDTRMGTWFNGEVSELEHLRSMMRRLVENQMKDLELLGIVNQFVAKLYECSRKREKDVEEMGY
ncbi:hypothetical protein Tco_1006075 [Tanacetum coccineum]|uniref:Uncharacterized protein n=1 Tax=Tanacetum coccineum TaxID=301880 RepID=A0ABQ5FJ17_9ASTR